MADEQKKGAVQRAAKALHMRVRLLQAVWKDPRTPWYARAVLGATVAYALSPIDLIPDFIPVLGHLDDAVIVPVGFLLAKRLVPRHVWDEHWRRIQDENNDNGEQEHEHEHEHE
jgi:uncharacterized membrane protein YkvA (DUF1232 family)